MRDTTQPVNQRGGFAAILAAVCACSSSAGAVDSGVVIDGASSDSVLVDADAGVSRAEFEWLRVIDTSGAWQKGLACGPDRMYSFALPAVIALSASGDELARLTLPVVLPGGELMEAADVADSHADANGLSVAFWAAPFLGVWFTNLSTDLVPPGATVVLGDTAAGLMAWGLAGEVYALRSVSPETRLFTMNSAGEQTLVAVENGAYWAPSSKSSHAMLTLPNGNLLACISELISFEIDYNGRLIEIDPVAGAVVRSVPLGDAWQCELIHGPEGIYATWVELDETENRYIAGRLQSSGAGWDLEPRTIRSAPKNEVISGPNWQLLDGTLYAVRRSTWTIDRIDGATLTHRGWFEFPPPSAPFTSLDHPNVLACAGGLYVFYRAGTQTSSELRVGLLGTISD